MAQREQEPACTSVFYDGSDTITRQQYTAAWVRLINQLERQKAEADQ